MQSFSNATGDFNNDGLPDIVVSNGNGYNVTLWENTSVTINNYLKVKPIGTISNRNGIGSRVYIYSNGVRQFRYIYCGTGYLAQNKGYASFGLGNATIVDSVVIEWISGMRDVVYNIESNQMIELVEGEGVTGIEDYFFSNIRVFPNPVIDHLSIETNPAQLEIYKIEISDLTGKLIKSINTRKSIDKIEIDLSDVPAGNYLLFLYSKQGVIDRKINVIH